MDNFLSRLFNIRSHEWPRVSLFFMIAFIKVTAITWGRLSAQPLFWEQVGVDRLGSAFVIEAVIALIAVAIYTPFADRIAHDKLLIIIVLFSVFAVAAGQVIIWLGLKAVAAYILYPLFQVIKVTFNLQWWTYVTSFYDIRASKRIVPFLASNARISSGLGGLSVTYLVDWLGTDNIFLATILALVSLTIILWLLPRILREATTSKTQEAQPLNIKAFLENTREGYHYVVGSSYLRWLALATVLATILITFFKYQSSEIIDTYTAGDSEAALKLLGQLEGWVNLALLPVQMFLLARLIGRIGLGNANLIYSIGSLIVAGLFFFPPLILLAGSLAYLGTDVFDATFRRSPYNLLYNAVPLRVKGRARVFVNGALVPLASLIGGIIVSIPFVLNQTLVLPVLITVISLASLLTMIVIRSAYQRALITMLEEGNFTSLLPDANDETLPLLDDTALRQLQQRLEASEGDESIIFMASLITEVADEETAVSILAQTAQNHTGHVRATMLNILAAADIQNRSVYDLYVRYLEDDNGEVRQAAIAGVAEIFGETHDNFLNPAHRLVNDPDLTVRARVLPTLLQADDAHYATVAQTSLLEMLQSPAADVRKMGAAIVGQVGNAALLPPLLPLCQDVDDTVRLEAAVALETIDMETVPEVIDKLLQDPMERIRQAAVNVIGKVGKNDMARRLLPLLDDGSSTIRQAAATALVQMGPTTIPLILSAINRANSQPPAMYYVVLCRLDISRFEKEIDKAIKQNLKQIYIYRTQLATLKSYARYPGIALLQATLRDLSQTHLYHIFDLLTSTYPVAEVQVMAESLQHEEVHIRAGAIEAFEIMTSPEAANLLSLLVDPDVPRLRLVAVAAETWRLPPWTAADLFSYFLYHEEMWLRLITIHSLGEVAQTMAITTKQNEKRHDAQLRSENMSTLFYPTAFPYTRAEVVNLLQNVAADATGEVQWLAQRTVTQLTGKDSEPTMLSAIEKIIFLREVSFFQEMSIDQLKVLAQICEEAFFEEGDVIFKFGDPGGSLYIVVRGKVGLDRPSGDGDAFIRLADVGPSVSFGEMTLLDGGPRSAAAQALQDTLVLQVRREPLLVLIRQYPDISLALINVLSQNLRKTSAKLANLSRAHSRQLQKEFDEIAHE